MIIRLKREHAASIGIIGGADGPTAIFLTTRLAPQLLGPIAIAAYSYMALIPMIQPPLMKLLTTKKEREVKMEQLRTVSKTEKILFPMILTVLLFQDFAIAENAVFLRNRLCARGIYRAAFVDHAGRIKGPRIFGNDRENAAVLHVAKAVRRFHSQMIIVIK